MIKKLLDKIFTRFIFVAVAIILQILWIIVAMYILSGYYDAINVVFLIISIILVFCMLIRWEDNPSYVLAWTVPMLAFPVFGLTLYFMCGRSSLTRRNRRLFRSIHEHYNQFVMPDATVDDELMSENKSAAAQSRYLTEWSGYPLWNKTYTRYFESGEAMFADMIEELKKAKHFIYMEFFIVANGLMWDSILAILEEKAASGVDVRFIYDDVGCIHTLPSRYYEELRKKGIKCQVFNPFRPVISIVMNNRNHRKIMVIDGHTAFTGGANLADEYINEKERFGYWKDTGIMLKGDAVWSFTLMFLEMWHYVTDQVTSPQELVAMRPNSFTDHVYDCKGYVQPYADSPFNREAVGENVYRNIISRATDYVYIYTPYLIIGSEMITTLCIAAKSGVDIRIITPEIPDKPLIFLMTQSYYQKLIKAGVKIYQFKPGFIHAKCFVSDDSIATVGTINLDYRSLHMHFENGCWLYGTDSVMDVKKDFLETLEQSREITLDFCKERSLIVRAIQAVFRLVAPLM